ncbi:MAG: thiamine biosynthesis protein ThiS [Candidatus Cloacimonas sp. SDB]|nr:MAG: thiamine biosynthesis protein ThiS [Candidatus Cloacimonas sp. SDB]
MKYIIVNGNRIQWQDNLTIRSLLKLMNYTFKMLIIKVNGELVKKEQYDTFLIPPEADVKVIHLISGG